MGQRSQIYIRCRKDGQNYLTARYYQWNYGERMISRCRHTLDWINALIERVWYFTTDTEKLIRILDTNFDMVDVTLSCDIVKEYNELGEGCTFSDYVFRQQDNNDGQLYIDIDGGNIKYAFLTNEFNLDKIMTATQYMDWNKPEWEKSQYITDEQKVLCSDNLKAIPKIAELMTRDELEEFINADYDDIPF